MRKIAIGIVCLAVLAAVGCSTPNETQTDLNALATAEDTAATANQQTAITAATEYWSNASSYAGFNAAAARQLEPGIQWTDAGPATNGQVSIRDVTPSEVVLVTKAQNGDPLCIAETSGSQTEGKVDAQKASDCTGGW